MLSGAFGATGVSCVAGCSVSFGTSARAGRGGENKPP